MPFTLFHYPFGYWLSKIDTKLVLPALLVGSVMPDIEVPFWFFFFTGIIPDHFILHSLIGALTIGLVLAVAVTKFIYPAMINWLFKVDRERLTNACRITPWMVLSCAIGLVGHIAVDYLHHWYNPIFWPWVDPFLMVGPLVTLFATIFATDILTGYSIANGIANVTMLVILILIVRVNKDNRWDKLWIGS
ncbi:MAG: DUF4184 family protein [Candidatus Thorarchaeota archaeon]|jgi:hypothetical protein